MSAGGRRRARGKYAGVYSSHHECLHRHDEGLGIWVGLRAQRNDDESTGVPITVQVPVPRAPQRALAARQRLPRGERKRDGGGGEARRGRSLRDGA